MLRQCTRKLQCAASSRRQQSVLQILPALSLRTASSYTKKATKPTEVSEEAPKFNRRYVEVDTPFARSNKYTYAMPDDPYVASEKVGKILQLGTVEDAADYIKALPLSLQSAVVWNQLIGHCAKHGRANYAEQYYSQMRKRGLEPNERTFTHLLTAYSKSSSPQAIKHAEGWIKKMSDFGIEPTTIHINNLMRVYNNAEKPEKTIAALKDMSAHGDCVPDAVTYSIALQGCVGLNQLDRAEEIRNIWLEIIYRMERNQRAHSGGSSLSRKSAEIVWTEDAIRKNTKDSELEIDDTLVVALLSAVTRTAASEKDVLIGIEALDRLYSLCPPRAAEMMEKNAVHRKSGFGFQPSVKVLDAILRFSGGLREFKLGEQYFHLALQQFPRLEPDKYVHEAFSWIEKQLKRRKNFEKKRHYRDHNSNNNREKR